MTKIAAVSFFYLSAFSTNGGIERFNRSFIYALNQNADAVNLASIYDKKSDLDQRYTINANFSGYKTSKWLTTLRVFFQLFLRSRDTLIIGHLNLAPLALFISFFRPDLKVILIGHGIDVWSQRNKIKVAFLKKVNEIWTVSSFTKERIVREYGLVEEKIKVFPNTLDPFLDFTVNQNVVKNLKVKYKINENDKVILTVCRMSSEESYKGYDRVIEALPMLKTKSVRYVLAGKYDENEKQRIVALAQENKVFDQLIFTSFIPDEELSAHYGMSNVFVMPSINEGFGIVYLEAMACGIEVIAGDLDGSKDALANGKLGTLIDPLSKSKIAKAIDDSLTGNVATQGLPKKMNELFGFDVFKNRQKEFLKRK